MAYIPGQDDYLFDVVKSVFTGDTSEARFTKAVLGDEIQVDPDNYYPRIMDEAINPAGVRDAKILQDKSHELEYISKSMSKLAEMLKAYVLVLTDAEKVKIKQARKNAMDAVNKLDQSRKQIESILRDAASRAKK